MANGKPPFEQGMMKGTLDTEVKALLMQVRNILRNRQSRKRFTRSMSIFAAVIVFVTTYWMVLPAITMEREAACGMEAHQHDESCYEDQLVCGIPEGEEHTHDSSCYAPVLVCGKEAHVHGTACYTSGQEGGGAGSSAAADSNGGAYEIPLDEDTGAGDSIYDGSEEISRNGSGSAGAESSESVNASDSGEGTVYVDIPGDASAEENASATGTDAAAQEQASQDSMLPGSTVPDSMAPDQNVPTVLTAAGQGYGVTVSFGPETGIPGDAVLDVQELRETEDAFSEYVESAEEALDWESGTAACAHLYDIRILDPVNQEYEYQPAEGTLVQVQIEIDDAQKPEEEDWNIVHFPSESVNLETAETANESEEFSGTTDSPSENVSGEYFESADSPDTEGEADRAVVNALQAAEPSAVPDDVVHPENSELLDQSDDLDHSANPETAEAAETRRTTEDPGTPKNPEYSEKPEDSGIPVLSTVPEKEPAGAAAASPQVLESTTDANTVSFETNGFSIYAVVSSGSTGNLNGKTFAIVNTNVSTHEAVRNKPQNNGTRLQAAEVTNLSQGGKTWLSGEDITLWTFTSANQGANSYYIQDPDGKYLHIRGNQNIGLSDTPQAITVSTAWNHSGQVRLTANDYAVNAWNDRVQYGFTGGNYNNNGEYFTLYEADEIIQNRAEKVSVTDLISQYTQENPVTEVVIYTRIENAEKDGYDYYAVASDGTLVKIHDIGDTVGWTSMEAPGKSLFWDLTVHVRNDVPNGYFDFQSEETGQYLLPAPDGILKTDDPEDSRDLGVNLSGWAAEAYGSTIERWDEGSHTYIGYAMDPQTGKLVPSAGGDQELEFLFAVMNPISGQETSAGLHTVETLNGRDKGIRIRLYDFDGNSLAQDWPPRSQEMTNVLGTGSIGSTNDNGVGYANRGLVSARLGQNGFPTATKTRQSLGNLFNDTHFVAEADNLFVKKVYDETGYYSYDSSINYAWLNRTENSFVLYSEVAAPAMEPGTTPSGQKGNFFPFDSLEDLARQGSVFRDRTVQYDGDLQQLPESHPQFGNTLYKVPDDGTQDGYASYFFGMTMEADFLQGKDGKDDSGGDTIFEFNGDDDMWLYIDGLLALDIGGCHGAVSGTINFATGQVKVNGSRPYSTTIKQLFRDARILPNGDPWNETDAAKYFREDTFADYTQHSFKMLYLERGSYASNLKVNFNLQTIEPGTFVLEKKLPDNVQSAYGNDTFAYQIYTVENGHEKTLYTPPVDGVDGARYVTYEGTGQRVLPEGQTESEGFKPSWTLDGRTYKNVYFLKPGQAMVFPVNDKSVQYYVREIGIDTNVFEKVRVNGEEVPVTTADSAAGQPEDLAPTHIAATDVSSVQKRGRVTYENIPKADHVHSLRLRKHVDSAIPDPDVSFRFDVQLESNRTGQLVPYYQGSYYIVKTDENGTDQYYKFENGELVPSDTPVAYQAGTTGSIANITPEYTILITGLLAGTDFRVVESMRENEMPAGYQYVKTEVEHADDADPGLTGSQGSIPVYQPSGSGDSKKDATVTITNRPTGRIVVEKAWESGDYVTAHGDVYVALYERAEEGSGSDSSGSEDAGDQEESGIQGGSGNTGTDTGSLTLVPGSARKLEWDAEAEIFRTEYWLPDDNLSRYVVREVSVTCDDSGEIISVDSIVQEGRPITVSGETTTGSGAGEASNTYLVHYEQGEENTYDLPDESVGGTGKTGRTRTDLVTNTMPAVSMFKINESNGAGKKYLSGAVFALEKADGTPVTDAAGEEVTFTSDKNGKLFEDRQFSDGTWYLRETKAPDGYNLLENRIILSVGNGTVTARMENPGTTLYSDLTPDDQTAFRFEINNNPGYELPSTGGPGTLTLYMLGLTLTAIAGAGLALSRRRNAA